MGKQQANVDELLAQAKANGLKKGGTSSSGLDTWTREAREEDGKGSRPHI
jgi:hypothetical protein